MKKTPLRRKSSSFRPHNWLYFTQNEPVHKNRLSLEQLPVVILESIFDHLQTPDLLKVCLLSRYFYLPSASRLYKNIIITGDELALSYSKTELSNWNRHFGTVIKPENIGSLLDIVMENGKIAELIHSIIITETLDIALVPKLLSYTYLSSFYYTGPIDLPHRINSHVRELTCSLLKSLNAPNLQELTLSHKPDASDSETYRSLALSMLNSNSHLNLRKLAFKHTQSRDLRNLNMLNVQREQDTRISAAWPSFFDVFALRNTKLSLESLALDGFLGANGASIVGLLLQAVELGELTKLQLRCTESSHPSAAHNQYSMTLLDAITLHTKRLKVLVVNPTDDCLTCQTDAIIHTLSKNLPHQLDELSLVYESSNNVVSEAIKTSVLQSQRSLIKLQVEDRALLEQERVRLYKMLNEKDISYWEHGSFYELRIKNALFPQSGDTNWSTKIVTDSLLKCLTQCKRQISEFLNDDIIYKNATSFLPSLTEYIIIDFKINMREPGLILNGQTIPFV